MNTEANRSWFLNPAQTIHHEAWAAAQAHQQQLTKPVGSLGVLEQIAARFAGFQGGVLPHIEAVNVVVFAADHGVCGRGVSAFPQAVTGQMVANFAAGGAAINVLSRHLGARLQVVNVGTVDPLPTLPDVLDRRVAAGTQDFCAGPAMTDDQCRQALLVGREQVQANGAGGIQLCIGGEMGIGNTTSAAAIYSALLNLPARQTVGPGTGLNQEGVLVKQNVVDDALTLHREVLQDPWLVLVHLGGFEIAALVGLYIASAQQGVPVLVDGFISTAAALLANALNPSVSSWFVYSHCSAEPAHQLALQALDARPLLDLGMRLGEGSGAALAVPLIQSALALHREMATFTDAGVASA